MHNMFKAFRKPCMQGTYLTLNAQYISMNDIGEAQDLWVVYVGFLLVAH